MANIGLDGRTRNDENGQDVQLRSKQMISNEGRSFKKQIFSELKNVMQNQQSGSTPVKWNTAAKIDGLPVKFSASISLCTDVLRKQQLKQNFLDAQRKLEEKYKAVDVAMHYKGPVFDEEIFDSWDFDRKCCQEQKREEEIWAEMDLEHLDFDSKFHCVIDEDEMNHCTEVIFDDFDEGLPVPTFEPMIEMEEPSICEMPPLSVYFEDLDF